MMIKVCGNCCSFMRDPHSESVGACSAVVVLTTRNKLAYPLVRAEGKACWDFKQKEKKHEQ